MYLNTVASAVPIEDQSDEELVSLFVDRGNEDAIDVLIRRYSPRLRRIIVSLVGGDSASILDAEQEVFVTVVRRLKSFRGQSKFSTFFYRLARNKVIDLARSTRRYGRRIVALEEPDKRLSRIPGPDKQAVDSERIGMLRTAMGVLNPQDRLMLYLKDGEGEGIDTLCEMTGLKSGTIKSRLARGRAKVANALEEMGYEH